MTATTPSQPQKKRFLLVLISNACVALLMLVAIPVIHNGHQGFAPHASVNREYVDAAIGSGKADFMNKALKTTEIARAMAHESHLSTMVLMQMAVGALAVLFFVNSLFLFRLHRQHHPAPAPRRP